MLLALRKSAFVCAFIYLNQKQDLT